MWVCGCVTLVQEVVAGATRWGGGDFVWVEEVAEIVWCGVGWGNCVGGSLRDGCMVDGGVYGWVGGWVDGWMGGWVDGWMGGWVDG